MKKWMNFVCVLLFIVFLPTAVAAAEDGRAVLTATGNDVSVALSLQEGKTETITSLRLLLRVSADKGTMEEPSFQFESAIKSTVRDASIRKEAGGSYLVDIILSGKKDQDIFKGSDYAKIGTLSVRPLGSEYELKVEAAGDESGPAVKYTDGSGTDEMTVSLADASAVVLKKTAAPVSSDFVNRPKLKVTGKSASNSLIFEWEKIENADGYVLYEYNTKTKKYTQIKTINGADVTAYSKKFQYASSHVFCLRAFLRASDGKETFGQYSVKVKVTLPPAKVKGFSVKKKSNVTLSWKKTAGAKGYQIYVGRKKKGKFTLLKTITKAKTTKFVVKKPKKWKTCYYKVRAYVIGANGKKKSGSFSAVKS